MRIFLNKLFYTCNEKGLSQIFEITLFLFCLGIRANRSRSRSTVSWRAGTLVSLPPALVEAKRAEYAFFIG